MHRCCVDCLDDRCICKPCDGWYSCDNCFCTDGDVREPARQPDDAPSGDMQRALDELVPV